MTIALGATCFIANRPRSGANKHVTETVTLPTNPHRFEGIVPLREAMASPTLRKHVDLALHSRGIPALETPVRPLRPVVPVEEMTWQQLRDTQADELPSVSTEAYNEMGAGVLSLDAEASFDDDDGGTLADIVPADHWVRKEFAELFEKAAEGDAEAIAEAKEVYDLWLDDEGFAVRYGTPLTVTSPDIRQRIEWERYVAQCSGISTHEGFKITDKSVTFFSWPATGRKAFLERKSAFIRRFMERHGLTTIPTIQQFKERQAKIRAASKDPAVIESRKRLIESLLDAEEARLNFTDDDFGTSEIAIDEPYIPSLAVITYSMMQPALDRRRESKEWDTWPQEKAEIRRAAVHYWESLQAEAEAEDEVRIYKFRSADDQYEFHHSKTKDSVWHAVPMEDEVEPPVVTLGFAFDLLDAE